MRQQNKKAFQQASLIYSNNIPTKLIFSKIKKGVYRLVTKIIQKPIQYYQ